MDGQTKKGKQLNMVMQVAEVKKLLVSVGKVTAANNRVVFDDDGSYIENKSNGERTKIEKENGVYTLEFWVKCEHNCGNHGDVSSVGNEITTGFPWLDESIL